MSDADLDVLTRIRSARDRAAERERHFEAQRDDAPLAAAVHVSIHAAIRATLDDILDPGREQAPLPTYPRDAGGL